MTVFSLFFLSLFDPHSHVVLSLGRQTILSTPEWNLLSAMLSGRWDKHLLKDGKGRIYLDYDSEWLSPILNLIRESTISVISTDDLILPTVVSEKRQGFNSVISFFGLDPKRVITVPRPYACFPPSFGPPPAVHLAARDELSRWIISGLSNPIDTRDGTVGEEVNNGIDTPTTAKKGSVLLQTLNWNLIYKGSRDGFTPADIKSKCGGKCNTVVVVTDTVGNVFGGFVEVPLVEKTVRESYRESKKAFLFSLQSANNVFAKPVKASLVHNGKKAVYYGNNSLFCLGRQENHDGENYVANFWLGENMTGRVSVDTTLQEYGQTFALDPGSDDSHTIFNNDQDDYVETEFVVVEVEVYTVEINHEEQPLYEREINRYLSTLLNCTFSHTSSILHTLISPSHILFL